MPINLKGLDASRDGPENSDPNIHCDDAGMKKRVTDDQRNHHDRIMDGSNRFYIKCEMYIIVAPIERQIGLYDWDEGGRTRR